MTYKKIFHGLVNRFQLMRRDLTDCVVDSFPKNHVMVRNEVWNKVETIHGGIYNIKQAVKGELYIKSKKDILSK